MKWSLLALPAATLWLIGSVVGQTPRNVSIDDQDSTITYQPSRESWVLTAPGEWDAGPGKAHMIGDTATTVATFTFTGVAFYYWAAMWPYAVFSTVTIDDKSSLVNLTDPSVPPTTDNGPPTRQSGVAFSATGLSNTTHTVQVSIGSAAAGNFAIVDSFTYTVLDPTLPTNASSAGPTRATESNTASSSSTSSTAVTSSSSKGLSTPVKVGIAVAVVGLMLLLLVLFLIMKWLRKRKQESEQSIVVGYSSPDPDYSGVSSMRQVNSPTPTNPIWTDPDYVEATRRMKIPGAAMPYQQSGSRSSVRLVPPEAAPTRDARMISDGSNYPETSFAGLPSSNAQMPYNPYGQPAPNPPYNPNYSYNNYGPR